MKKLFLSYLLIALTCAPAIGQESVDSARLSFRQSHWTLDDAFGRNGESMREMVNSINSHIGGDSARYSVSGISVVGGASPEGSVAVNSRLSHQRAATIFDFLSNNTSLPDSLATFTYLGRDWAGLLALVESDTNVPYRDETISLLSEIVAETETAETPAMHNLERLKSLRAGVPYNYMYTRLFPALRESRLYVSYVLRRPALSRLAYMPGVEVNFAELVSEPITIAAPRRSRPFYMALKTNMLHDALALPSIGAEFYLGKNLSLAANWTYGWWDTDRTHHYWRAYGGDLALRWWFGRRAHEKPLTRHHLGVYGGVLTYDFELGGTGYMGGIPGGTLWDRCLSNAGIEYGYSLPVSRRINIDFTIGFGVLSGKYVKYVPYEGGYLWQSTRHINWVGPTKAEISLVWLIGCGNYNAGKGGRK